MDDGRLARTNDGTLLDDVLKYVLRANTIRWQLDSGQVRAMFGTGELGRSVEAYLLGARQRVDDLRVLFISFLERQLQHPRSADARGIEPIDCVVTRLLEVVRT